MSLQRKLRCWLAVLTTSSVCVLIFRTDLLWKILPGGNIYYKGKDIYSRPDQKLGLANDGSVSCDKLFKGDSREVTKAKALTERNSTTPEYDVLEKSCEEFLTMRSYIRDVGQEEQEFPLAYSILLYRDFEQFERLLRAIYRPSNFYCVHIDQKANQSVKSSVERLVSCLSNVTLASRGYDVQWGTMTVLKPELTCMKDLLQYKGWKYFINLTGQEYPLKTNLQLIRIMKAYNGANDIEGTVERIPDSKDRWGRAGEPPPHNIRPVKGAVHVIVNRKFVEYAINNQTARDLLGWVRKTHVPDETFFATLNHNPQLQIPGSYIGKPETNWETKPFLARFKLWGSPTDDDNNCQGKYVRSICIFGVGDLAKFPGRPELFANKFHFLYEPVALDCMDEWYFGLLKREKEGRLPLNQSYYANLGFVQNQVLGRTR